MTRDTEMVVATTPESTLVFIVGHCAEFEKGREELGDKQLDACFQLYGARRVVFVKDDECTKENCEFQLQRLLQTSSRKGDTLVFYYGGHGTKKGFSTIGRKWRYSDAVDTIEQCFRGDKVWCLIDCCYSGCFSHHISPTTNNSWLCVMSSEATVEAGDEWCMTDTFSKAMLGLLHKPRAATTVAAADDHGSHLLTQDVVELMEDHHAVIKDDWLQATLTGTLIDATAPFPFLISKDKLTMKQSVYGFGIFGLFITSFFDWAPHFGNATNMKQGVSARRGKVKPPKPVVDTILWKRQVALQKGDKVYCKWQGGSPQPGASYLFPLYFPATLLSDASQKEVEVEFDYKDQRWTCTVEFRTHVVPATYLWMVIDDYIRAHRILTKHGRYLDATVTPGTKVWALFEDDDVVYTGTVLDYHETNWHKVKINDHYEHCTGPFLWLEWKDEDGNNDIVPKNHCVVISAESRKPTLEELRAQASDEPPAISARDAVLQHMETLGKRLVLEPAQNVTCLWDGEWHPARTCEKMPLCKILRQHLEFENCKGNYYCVYWTKEGEYSLVPERLIRRYAEGQTGDFEFISNSEMPQR